MVKVPSEEHAELIKCSKVTVMTGAGISAASGVPTFRGQDGFWKDPNRKRYAGNTDPMDICLREMFDKNPMVHWEWHYDFLVLARGKQINNGHKAVTKFLEFCCQDKRLDALCLTQNIDNLHVDSFKQS